MVRATRLLDLQGRSQKEAVAAYLGHEMGRLALVRPAGGAVYSVSGYAVVPPHGHCNTRRQLLLLNGRRIKAPAVSRCVSACDAHRKLEGRQCTGPAHT